MTNTSVTNPYVGPRAFETENRQFFFGRDRETMDLLDLLIAERIVMLYSPSGAGKSSLVQAGLIPELNKEGFTVLPVIRVSQQAPADFALPPDTNRYIFSGLLSLEEGLPPDRQIPLETCASLDLDTYLEQRRERVDMPGSTVLIFDQFEEILTIDPTNQTAKVNFFDQVGHALRDPDTWAIFSLREDYIAGLDPYLRAIPTRLSTTFRLELLGKSAAQQAMQGPAKRADVDFTAAAATKLVGDLSQVRVQQRDGQIKEQEGLYIEPVQLQVVCNRLWAKKFPAADGPPGAGATIEPVDVEEVGDVDTALAGYYADRVAAIAAATGVSERIIRNWCDTELITTQNIRGQVLRGRQKSQGLDNRVIETLVDAHLIRAEDRRGVTWYELAHDRLIKPVQDDNAAWQEANLNMLQKQAALWEKQNRPDGLLLQDTDLVEAEQWAKTHSNELTSTERHFLAKSRDLQAMADVAQQAQEAETRAEEQAKVASSLRKRAVLAGILGAVAVLLAIVAMWFAQQAQNNAQVAQVEADRAGRAEATAQVDAIRARDAESTARSEAFAAQTAEADAELQAAAAQAAQAEAVNQAATAQAAQAEAVNRLNSGFGFETAVAQTATAGIEGVLVAQATAVSAQQTAIAAQNIAVTAQANADLQRATAEVAKNEAEAASTIAIAQQMTAEAERQSAVEARADLAKSLENSLEAATLEAASRQQVETELRVLQVTQTAAAQPTPTFTPTPRPTSTPSPTPDQTATAAAAQTRQAEVNASRTAEAKPSFPPDGRIAFASNRETLSYEEYDLFLLDDLATGDASGIEQLTRSKDVDPASPSLSYSPETNTLVFGTKRGDQLSISAIKLSDGTHLDNVGGADWKKWQPAISPNGQRIAFVSDHDNNPEIYMMNLDGSSVVRLTNHPRDDFMPAWSPDGRFIVYASKRDNVEGQPDCNPGEEQKLKIWILDVQSHSTRRLTCNDAGDDVHPTWSPADGQKIAFTRQLGERLDIYVMNINNPDNPTNLTDSAFPDNFPAWSLDGKWVTFSRFTTNVEVFMMTADGDLLTQLTNNPATDFYPVWVE